MDFVLQQGNYQPPPEYSPLKRGRASPDAHNAFQFKPALAPSLPQIQNIDLLLQVFTHPSLRSSGPPDSEYTDNERLTCIGSLALDTTLTDIILRQRPPLTADEISEKKAQILVDETYDDWVSHYGLLGKLRCKLDLRLNADIKQPKETRAILEAYVGGVYIDSGYHALRDWLSKLLAQYLDPNMTNTPGLENETGNEISPPATGIQTPPVKRVKAEPTSPREESPPIFYAKQPLSIPAFTPPSNPPYQPVHAPPSFHPPGMTRHNPLSPAQPNLPFLPLFNQTASQRRVQVEYLAQFSGPSHAGTWLVRCVVNGITKGEGRGSSKQMAKEEAARQAFYAMGWT